jgi:esterase
VPIQLAHHSFGSGPPLIILHGLFGCKDNWRYLARQLARHFRVITLDQRNHGQSPHCEEFGYQAMADDLLAFLDSQNLHQVHLLGHSMGGKTAMQFAACYPQRLTRLIIEDISPIAYSPRHLEIFAALDQLPLNQLASRSEADRLLQATVPDLSVRQFLLKNLQREPGGGLAWRFNLPVLKKHYPNLISTLDFTLPIKVPTLFLRGGLSDYLPPALPLEITRAFQEVKLQTIEGAGHWVHAEQPQAFLQAINDFLLVTSGT